MPAGRPVEYRPSFGDEIINLMAEGYSITAAAAALGFHRDTIYAWAEKYPEFSDALKLGRGKRVLKLETDLLGAKDGPTVTSRIFGLKNACPDEWRDRVVQEVTGKDGGAVQVEVSARDRIARQLARIAAAGGAGEDPREPDGS